MLKVEKGKKVTAKFASAGKRKRSFVYSEKVHRWLPVVQEVRSELGFTEEQYPDFLFMALINIESGGDEWARRYNTDSDGNKTLSQFCGLLQIGVANAAGLGRTNEEFMGNGRLSIKHFIQSMENRRKPQDHKYDPRRMAIGWHGGFGSLRKANRFYEQNPQVQLGSLEEYQWLEENNAGANGAYAAKYDAAIQIWGGVSSFEPPLFSKDSAFGISSSEARDMYSIANDISDDDDPLEARKKWVLKLEDKPLEEGNETIPDLWESNQMERFEQKDNFYECLIVLNKIPQNDNQIFELLREALDRAANIFAYKFHNFNLPLEYKIKNLFFVRDYKIDPRGNGKLKVLVRTPKETAYFLEPDGGYDYFSINDVYGAKEITIYDVNSSTYTFDNFFEYISRVKQKMLYYNNINQETETFEVDLEAIYEKLETIVTKLIEYINDYQEDVESVVFKFDPSIRDSIADISIIDSEGNRFLVSIDYKYLLEDLGMSVTETHLMFNLDKIYSLDETEVSIVDFVYSFIRPIPEAICDDDTITRMSNNINGDMSGASSGGRIGNQRNNNLNDKDLKNYAKDTGSACKSVPEIAASTKKKIRDKILKINSNISAVRELKAIDGFTEDQGRSLINSLRKNVDISLSSLISLDIPNILNNFYICQFGTDLSCSGILKHNAFGEETVKDLFRLQTLKDLLFNTNKEIVNSFVQDTKKDLDSFYNLANRKYKKSLTEKRNLIREIISNIKTEISGEFDYDRDGDLDRIKDFTREVTIRALVRSLPRMGINDFTSLSSYVFHSFDRIYGNNFFITKESLVSEINSRIEQTLADDSQNITDLNNSNFINSFINNIYYDLIDEFLTQQIFDELFTASYPWFSPEIDGTGKAINVAASRIIFKLSETFDINISTQSESAQNLSIPLDPRIASELSEYSFIDTSNELESVENLFKGEVERIIKDYDEIVIYESNDEIIEALAFSIERRKNKVITELSKTIDKLSVGFIEQQDFIEQFDKLASEVIRDIEELASITFEDSFTFSLENLSGFEIFEYFDDYEENLINSEYNNSLQEPEKLKRPIKVIKTKLEMIEDYVPRNNEPISDVNLGNRLPIGGVVESIRSFAKGDTCLTNIDFLSKEFCGIRFGAAFRFRMPFINYLPILDLKFGRFDEFERVFDLSIRQFFTSLRKALMIALEKSCEDRQDDDNTNRVELLDPLPTDNSAGFVESLASSRGIEPYDFTNEIERFARRLSVGYSPIELCLAFSGEVGADLLNAIYSDLRDFQGLSKVILSQAQLELLLGSMGLDFGLDSCSRYFEQNDIDSAFEDRIVSRSPKCLDDIIELSRTRLIDLGVPESIANSESQRQLDRSNQLSDLIKDLIDNPIGEDFFNNCPESIKEQGLDNLRDDMDFFISQYVSKFNDAVRGWSDVFFEIKNEKRQVDVKLAKEVLGIEDSEDPDEKVYNPLIKNLINLGVDEDEFKNKEKYVLDAPARVFNDSFIDYISGSAFADDSYLTLLPDASQTFENTLKLIYKDNDVPAEFTNLLESRYKSLNYDFGTSEDKIILRGKDKRVYNLENDIDSLMFDEDINTPYFAQVLNGFLSDKANFTIESDSKYFLSEFVNFYKEHLNKMLDRNKMIRKVDGEYLIEYLNLDSSSSKCGSAQELLRKEDIINKSIDRAADKCSQDDVKDFYESAMSLTNVDLLLRISVIEFFLNNFVIFANYKAFFVNGHIIELITESVIDFLQTLDEKTYDEFTNKIDKDITDYIKDFIIFNAYDISYRMNNIFGFELYDFDADSTFHYINSLEDLGYGYVSLSPSPKTEYPGGLYRQKYYRLELSNDCPDGIRRRILGSSLFDLDSQDLTEVFIEEDKFFKDLNSLRANYGGYNIERIFSRINLGIRIIYVTNNPDVRDTLVDLGGELKKMKLGRYEGTDATFLPIISSEYSLISMFDKLGEIDPARLTSVAYQNLLRTLTLQQDTIDLFGKYTPYSNLLMYSILYNKTFYEQTTEIEDIFFSVKRSIVNGTSVISNLDNFDNDGNPEIMNDSIEFDKIIESLLNPESRGWLPEFLNPNKDRVNALEAVKFALKAARETSKLIFKAYVEFSDPNIAIASQIHNFSGKKIPIIAASLGQLPVNVIPPPLGFGPPLTPAGFIYLALFGIDLSFLFNTEEEKGTTSIEKNEEC